MVASATLIKTVTRMVGYFEEDGSYHTKAPGERTARRTSGTALLRKHSVFTIRKMSMGTLTRTMP